MPTKKARKVVEKKEKNNKINEPKKGPKREQEKKHNIQLLWLIVFMIFALLAVFLFSKIFKEAGKFTYEGLEFNRIKYGTLTLYHATFGIIRSDGNFDYNLFLRHDPRGLTMPSNASIEIRNNVYFATSPEVESCEEKNLAILNIGQLVIGIGAKVNYLNYSEVSCNNDALKTIILFEEGQPRIEQNRNCYILYAQNCEVEKVAEKFMLEAVLPNLQKLKS